MIRLSYTSINDLYNGHSWLNRQMGIKIPDYPFLKEGNEAHRIIQDHVSGKTSSELLKHIKVSFPIVEEISDEKDPNYWKAKEKCKFSKIIGDKYEIFGFIDGINEEEKKFLEIKSSSDPWSVVKFKNAMQRKIYAWARPDFEEAYLITGQKDPERWLKEPPKIYSLKNTDQDREEAENWILEGIKILEIGVFNKGLDENGKCMGCFWNMARYKNLANCAFL